jgi:hypothetical protein
VQGEGKMRLTNVKREDGRIWMNLITFLECRIVFKYLRMLKGLISRNFF